MNSVRPRSWWLVIMPASLYEGIGTLGRRSAECEQTADERKGTVATALPRMAGTMPDFRVRAPFDSLKAYPDFAAIRVS